MDIAKRREASKSADSCKRCATPNLPSGSLGACAVVGLGETALDGEFGREIDAHDTVIRFGYAPTKGYEKYVGTRTDVALVRMHRFERGCDLDKDVWGFEPKPPKKFYLLLQTDSKGKGNGMKVPSSLSRSTRQHKCNPSDVGVYRGVRVLYIKDPPPEVTDVRDKLFANGVRKSRESSGKNTFLGTCAVVGLGERQHFSGSTTRRSRRAGFISCGVFSGPSCALRLTCMDSPAITTTTRRTISRSRFWKMARASPTKISKIWKVFQPAETR